MSFIIYTIQYPFWLILLIYCAPYETENLFSIVCQWKTVVSNQTSWTTLSIKYLFSMKAAHAYESIEIWHFKQLLQKLGTFDSVLIRLNRCPMSILFFSHLGAVFYRLKKYEEMGIIRRVHVRITQRKIYHRTIHFYSMCSVFLE